MAELTKKIKTELISRNPAFQFAEDLPILKGEYESHINDEFGFGLLVKNVAFEKLNYLMSLLISEPFQSGENIHGERSNTYSCKLQKCFGHLTEKEDGVVEVLILQDSDEKPIAVEATTKLVDDVTETLEEVSQEISEIMVKLKAKSKNNEAFDEQFNKLSEALATPLKKSDLYHGLISDLEDSFKNGRNFEDLPELLMKKDELDKKFRENKQDYTIIP